MSWDGYLESFHAERPGITEAVLRRARADGIDPYDWLAEVVPSRGRVLDLGCGGAPLFRVLAGRSWIGLDTSEAELAAAHAAGAWPLLRARACAIPLRDASVDVVACSMSLMVTTPLPQVIVEITRVLRPGGLLAATIPATGPLRPLDWVAVAGLIAALGRAPAYPAGRDMARIPSLLTGQGLRVITDGRRRFGGGCAVLPTLTSSCPRCTCSGRLPPAADSSGDTSASSHRSATKCRCRCAASPPSAPEPSRAASASPDCE